MFPKEETYGLTSQIRRSAVSIPSNIAEGHARNTTGEFIQFLGIAKGSLAELDTQVVIAVELNFLSKDQGKLVREQISDINRLTNGLLKSLKS